MHTGLFVFLFTFFYLSFSVSRTPVQGRRLLSPYMPRHALPAVAFLPAAMMIPVKAYVVPEYKRADWTTPCTDADSPTPTLTSGEATVADASVTPVTVTVTVFAPQASLSSSGSHSSAHTTTGVLTGDGNVNGTVAYTSTTTTAAPTTAVNATVSSAQRAQNLNAEFSTLTLGDSCTPGQRACIGTKIAECSNPISSSDTPRWVAQTCTIPNSNSNELSICAAVPATNSTTTTTTTTSTLSSSNSSTPVDLGCFVSSDIAQRFASAGVSGGMYPPGFQTSGAVGRLVANRIGALGVAALIAGLLAW